MTGVFYKTKNGVTTSYAQAVNDGRFQILYKHIPPKPAEYNPKAWKKIREKKAR